MAFVKKTWVDRLSEFPGRRLLKKISGSADSEMVVDVTRSEGTVSRAGDPYSAANMNDLEQRIADEFDEINNDLGGCNIIPEGSGANTKYYIQLGADTASKKLLGSNFKITINCSVGAYDVNGQFSWDKTYDLILISENGNITASSNILSGTRMIYGNYFQPVLKINSISISYK